MAQAKLCRSYELLPEGRYSLLEPVSVPQSSCRVCQYTSRGLRKTVYTRESMTRTAQRLGEGTYTCCGVTPLSCARTHVAIALREDTAFLVILLHGLGVLGHRTSCIAP